jgi:hypothetical protein
MPPVKGAPWPGSSRSAVSSSRRSRAASAARRLLDHVPAAAPGRVPRAVLNQARRLADPAGDWAAPRSAPGGKDITREWPRRDRALAAYRAHLTSPEMAGIGGDLLRHSPDGADLGYSIRERPTDADPDHLAQPGCF